MGLIIEKNFLHSNSENIMGMYDTIQVQMKIPGYSEIPNNEFQTKSLDCTLDNYVITTNGELYKESWEYKWIDDETQPYFKGYSEKIPESYRREYLTTYHGDIIFYSSKKVGDMWRYYFARFTEGKLTRMWYEDKQY